jgi:hypothetical protein
MRTIYKFHVDCGRMGDLDGVFSADSEDVEKLLNREVFFGEVLGKHSDISEVIDEENLTAITTNAEFIELFDKYELSNGFNPFDYIEYDNDDIDEEDED